MRLKNTKALLTKKVQENKMESYAVLININGEKGLIMSDDVNEDTYFDVASVGKILVTTQLILKAISDGKLELDNTLSDYFENVPEEKKNITIKHLLTHTSGIKRYPIPAEICARNNNVIAAHILSFPLEFIPESDCIYSCSGMMLLGYILEKIYGQTLDEIFFAQVKHPLGIDRARFNIAIDEENAANCCHREKMGLRRMDDETVVLLRNGVSGAGGSFWSIKSIKTLVEAILKKDERLYSKELFDIAETDYTTELGESRGLGYEFDKMKGNIDLGGLFPSGTFGHMGWTGATVHINREKNMYAIILSNTRKCLMNMNKYPNNYGYDKDGEDMVYMQFKNIYKAIKSDLVEQGLI